MISLSLKQQENDRFSTVTHADDSKILICYTGNYAGNMLHVFLCL